MSVGSFKDIVSCQTQNCLARKFKFLDSFGISAKNSNLLLSFGVRAKIQIVLATFKIYLYLAIIFHTKFYVCINVANRQKFKFLAKPFLSKGDAVFCVQYIFKGQFQVQKCSFATFSLLQKTRLNTLCSLKTALFTPNFQGFLRFTAKMFNVLQMLRDIE